MSSNFPLTAGSWWSWRPSAAVMLQQSLYNRSLALWLTSRSRPPTPCGARRPLRGRQEGQPRRRPGCSPGRRPTRLPGPAIAGALSGGSRGASRTSRSLTRLRCRTKWYARVCLPGSWPAAFQTASATTGGGQRLLGQACRHVRHVRPVSHETQFLKSSQPLMAPHRRRRGPAPPIANYAAAAAPTPPATVARPAGRFSAGGMTRDASSEPASSAWAWSAAA
jgi:hypothetical protein